MSEEKQPQKTVAAVLWGSLRDNAPPRFDAYTRPKDHSELDPVARYLWNEALCEALHPSLHACELTLKNAIHRSLAPVYGDDWFDKPGLLQPYQLERVAEAKLAVLNDDRKLVTPDRIVAKLSFGFWTSLFSDRYEELIREVLADRLKDVPADMKTRHQLAEHFNEIRKLRNRAFHYEPIWRIDDLLQRQRAIRDSAGWVSPLAARILLRQDRFIKVYNLGWTSIRNDLILDLNKEAEKRRAKNTKSDAPPP